MVLVEYENKNPPLRERESWQWKPKIQVDIELILMCQTNVWVDLFLSWGLLLGYCASKPTKCEDKKKKWGSTSGGGGD